MARPQETDARLKTDHGTPGTRGEGRVGGEETEDGDGPWVRAKRL